MPRFPDEKTGIKNITAKKKKKKLNEATSLGIFQRNKFFPQRWSCWTLREHVTPQGEPKVEGRDKKKIWASTALARCLPPVPPSSRDKGLEKDSSFVFLSLDGAVSHSTLDCLVIPLINQFSSAAPSHSFKGSTSLPFTAPVFLQPSRMCFFLSFQKDFTSSAPPHPKKNPPRVLPLLPGTPV